MVLGNRAFPVRCLSASLPKCTQLRRYDHAPATHSERRDRSSRPLLRRDALPSLFSRGETPLSGRCQRQSFTCLLSNSRCHSFSSNSTWKTLSNRFLGERPRSAQHKRQRLRVFLGGACWSGLSPFVRLKSMAVCRSGYRTKTQSSVARARCSTFRSAPTTPPSLRCLKCCGGGALIPQRYFLSAKACLGILRRAMSRGKQLPPLLKAALERTAMRAEPQAL